jgi:DNA-binding transcriptional MocR family regulator
MTEWKPTINKGSGPLSLSLVQALGDDIANGKLSMGQRLPTQRELADQLKIAVGTVTKAYKEAERRGLIYGDGRRGTFVGEIPSGRRLLATLSNPHNAGIDLSKNHPAHSLDPDLGAVLRQIARKSDCQNLLRYPPPAGLKEHRQAGARWIESLGLKVDPDDVFISSGAQHAMMVIIEAEAHPGDIVATEEYAYPGVKAIAETLGLELVGIPMDNEGVIPDALEAACRHKNIRLLYCNPSFQNPTNRIFTSERRKQIATIAEKHDMIIIEDEILAPFLNQPPEFMKFFAPERTYFVISTSKAIAAGLRLGFIVAPFNARQRLSDSLQASNLGGPPLMAEVFSRWLDDGVIEQTISRRKKTLGQMYRITCEMLKGYKFCAHDSSYHVWLELPGDWTGIRFAMEAQNRGVIVAPSEIFAVDKKSPINAVRLSIGGIADREYLERGLTTLANLLSGSLPKSTVTV